MTRRGDNRDLLRMNLFNGSLLVPVSEGAPWVPSWLVVLPDHEVHLRDLRRDVHTPMHLGPLDGLDPTAVLVRGRRKGPPAEDQRARGFLGPVAPSDLQERLVDAGPDGRTGASIHGGGRSLISFRPIARASSCRSAGHPHTCSRRRSSGRGISPSRVRQPRRPRRAAPMGLPPRSARPLTAGRLSRAGSA